MGNSTSSKLVSKPFELLAGIAEDNGLRNPEGCTQIGQDAEPQVFLFNSYVVDSPQPANLSYAWNFGSLLALCLGIQIVTGVLLAMHYNSSIDLAFVSVEHDLDHVL